MVIPSIPWTSDLAQGLWTEALSYTIDETGFLNAVRSFKSTAMLCGSFSLCTEAMGILDRNGIRVPEDISLLSLGTSLDLRPHFRNVSAFEYPYTEIARQILPHMTSEKEDVAAPKYLFHGGR